MSSPPNTPPSKKECGAPSFFGKPVSPPHPHAFDEHYFASVHFQYFLYEAQKHMEVHSKQMERGEYITTSNAGHRSISLSIGEMDNVVKYMTQGKMSLFLEPGELHNQPEVIDAIRKSLYEKWVEESSPDQTPVKEVIYETLIKSSSSEDSIDSEDTNTNDTSSESDTDMSI